VHSRYSFTYLLTYFVDASEAGDARKVRKQARNERKRRNGHNARIAVASIVA